MHNGKFVKNTVAIVKYIIGGKCNEEKNEEKDHDRSCNGSGSRRNLRGCEVCPEKAAEMRSGGTNYSSPYIFIVRFTLHIMTIILMRMKYGWLQEKRLGLC